MPSSHTIEAEWQHTEPPYTDWNEAEKELRAVLLATTRGMQPWFAEREEAAEQEASHLDPETRYGDEGYTAFMDDVGIFWDQYWEQIAGFVIKEAFKLFEVFLESSAQRILRRYGSGLVRFGTDDSWNFGHCKQFYRDYLGVDVLPEPIENLKWIRDKLSHLQELRTASGKQLLATHMDTLGLSANLAEDEQELNLYHDDWTSILGVRLTFTPLQTWRVLQLLRNHINTLAIQFHRYSWPRNGQTTEALCNLSNGIAVNPRRSSSRLGDSIYLVIPGGLESQSGQ
ncbi:hypothetical protein [Paenarthrobacter nicotinovorans]|uniref:hypothetical protein n=1 Tax=Paenarthrobacter nicotinovorans TaxID=29320 RepID=UPI003A8073BD